MTADGALPGRTWEARNPADRDEVVGHVATTSPAGIEAAVTAAERGFLAWSAVSAEERARILRAVSDLYEENLHELMALCVREAGKPYLDAVAEVREAVGLPALLRETGPKRWTAGAPLGPFVCISPLELPPGHLQRPDRGRALGRELGARKAR